ncbi:hypothetical protein DV704_10190 [Meiothermus sp. QL-1]|uniref:SHOCT-like domain-containing protein n=1 Tax=Meiothermus sp. QL-1 TaxID=2058095 RepID=UPI000E0ADEBE|nr:hypothetical protein [Meiothermus sp. QL-1]RDI94831.1 hypothetical protein DV704_10190 [Meiothermus sp. QL-1]
MDERSRIRNLLEEGRITREEAELLLSALEEAPSGPASPPPEGLRWVRVRMVAGEIEARLEPSLGEPVVEGAAEVRSIEEGLQVEPSFLGRMGTLELRLPAGWGLELEAKAAQVEAQGLPFLRGRVTAGNVELQEVEGLDLEVVAGNVEGSLLLKSGQHRLRVFLGNAELRFLPESSVRLRTQVGAGRRELRGFEPLGGEARMGEGLAQLEVNLRMGNLEATAG